MGQLSRRHSHRDRNMLRSVFTTVQDRNMDRRLHIRLTVQHFFLMEIVIEPNFMPTVSSIKEVVCMHACACVYLV